MAALPYSASMTLLTAYGFASVALMLLFYALEDRSHWFVLLFAVACVMSAIYGFLQGAWPFGAVESVWTIVALRRWINLRPATATAATPT
jgi:hypothetical protein